MDSLENFDNVVAKTADKIDSDFKSLEKKINEKKETKNDNVHITKMFKGNSYQGLDTKSLLEKANKKRNFRRNFRGKSNDRFQNRDISNDTTSRPSRGDDELDRPHGYSADSDGNSAKQLEPKNAVDKLITNGID